MAYTTIDIENLDDRKKAAIDRGMSLKGLVNTALDQYLEDSE